MAWPDLKKKKMTRNMTSETGSGRGESGLPGPIGAQVRGSSLTLLLFSILFIGLLSAAGCSGNDEDSFFQQASAQFEKGDYIQAVKTYEAYLGMFQKGERREEALFRMGQVLLFTLQEKARAVHCFRLLMNEHPKGDYAYRAREIMAPLFADDIGNYSQAVIEYRWLAWQRPKSPKAPGYLFQAVKCLLTDGKVEDAILELGFLIRKYPQSELIESVWDELAAAYMLIERYDQAIFISKQFLRLFPESPLFSTAELRLARAFEENQQYEKALKVYARLLHDYDNPDVVRIRIEGIKERWKAKYKKPIPADLLPQPIDEDHIGYDNESILANREAEAGVPGERLNRSAVKDGIDNLRIKDKVLKEKNKK